MHVEEELRELKDALARQQTAIEALTDQLGQLQDRAVPPDDDIAHDRLRPGSVSSSLQMMDSITSSAPAPIEVRRPSR